MDIDSQVDN